MCGTNRTRKKPEPCDTTAKDGNSRDLQPGKAATQTLESSCCPQLAPHINELSEAPAREMSALQTLICFMESLQRWDKSKDLPSTRGRAQADPMKMPAAQSQLLSMQIPTSSPKTPLSPHPVALCANTMPSSGLLKTQHVSSVGSPGTFDFTIKREPSGSCSLGITQLSSSVLNLPYTK